MRKEYDFSRMTGRKNPHVRRLKKQVTIRLGIEAIEPQQRAHSPQLAAGLASEYPNSIISPYGRRFPAACCRVLQYFKEVSEVTGIPYQSLINSYLTDCARNQRKLVVNWS